MFDTISPAPPDAILGLTEAFKKDPNPRKDQSGRGCLQRRRRRDACAGNGQRGRRALLTGEKTKSYLPIDGSPDMRRGQAVFGDSHEIVTSWPSRHRPGPRRHRRAAGGRGFCLRNHPGATVWISDPTWPNHPSVFESAGLKVATYPYFDPATNGVDFDAMLAAIRTIPAGDVLLLHGCCHNPTGVDLSPDQWQAVAEIADEAGDAAPARLRLSGLCRRAGRGRGGRAHHCRPLPGDVRRQLLLQEFWPLQRAGGRADRRGPHADAAEAALSHVKRCIRANYSNPPAHGGEIVRTILGDPELRRSGKRK